MLPSGAKLGPYEIQSPLGAGGMGEVYRARDTRLDRTVAIKILPAHLAADPAAKQRFEREARAISSLQHPNICVLHDVGHQDGTDFLVMEYLEGETLADRLRKGPLPTDQVLKYGIEICDGLEKAHRTGVVHRDLKPGNIILTKSGAKLLDFGLAKPLPASPISSGLTQTALTPDHPLTTEGTIVGTFQYMAPEQVEGREADARSDVFAFGAVLYEMITGKRAFEGKTTASTIAAILAAEPPPLTLLQPLSPPALENVVRSCLAKDPDDRLQTVHDVKLQLKWIAANPTPATAVAAAPPVRKLNDRLGWLLAGLLALLLSAGAITWWSRIHQPARTQFFSSAFPLPAIDMALSPDSRYLALVAFSDQRNKNALWVQELGGRTATPLPDTDGATYPFWSPDSRSLAFFAQGKLMRIDPSSGRSPQILCDAIYGRGGTWNRDGVIVFTPDAWSGLFRVSASGGTPVQISRPDTARLEQSHRFPVFLPDQRHFLYLAANFSGRFEANAIFAGALDSDEKHHVIDASTNVSYADPGYLLYWKDKALVAQHFDLHNYTLTGDLHSITDSVQYFPTTDRAVFDAVNTSVLVAQTGEGAARSQLGWFDRAGKPLASVGSPGVFANAELSPDGRRVALDLTGNDGRHVNIYILDLATNAMTRLGFGSGLQQDSIWSPDGKRVIFGQSNDLRFVLFQMNADGSGSELRLADLQSVQQGPWSWSRDGQYVLVRKNSELWYLTVPDGQTHQLLADHGTIRNAQFSPDGKWFAYTSNETGAWEVYVSPFPHPTSRWQVSRGGGEEPRWRSDGKELFFLSPDHHLMSVAIQTAASFSASAPTPLFQARTRQPISAMDFFSYDITPDGQKFLINTKLDTANSPPPSIVLNWASDPEK